MPPPSSGPARRGRRARSVWSLVGTRTPRPSRGPFGLQRGQEDGALHLGVSGSNRIPRSPAPWIVTGGCPLSVATSAPSRAVAQPSLHRSRREAGVAGGHRRRKGPGPPARRGAASRYRVPAIRLSVGSPEAVQDLHREGRAWGGRGSRHPGSTWNRGVHQRAQELEAQASSAGRGRRRRAGRDRTQWTDIEGVRQALERAAPGCSHRRNRPAIDVPSLSQEPRTALGG